MSSGYAFATPSAAGPSSSQRRPQHQYPPALQTSMTAVQRQGGLGPGQTPTSGSTLSSPFTGYVPAFFGASPSGTSTPQQLQNTRGATTAYNPQEWTPGPQSPLLAPNFQPRASANVNQTRQIGGNPSSDDLGGLSPPPPYSPQRNAHATESPSSRPTTSTPDSTRQVDAESSSTQPYSHASVQSNNTASPHISPTPRFPPPPLPAAGHRDRSASRGRGDRAQTVLNFTGFANRTRSGSQQSTYEQAFDRPAAMSRPGTSLDTRNDFDESPENEFARPPASRRAASTGAIGSQSPQIPTRSSGRSSAAQAWQPGMPLPPPPPGPPPNSRSQSMSRAPEVSPPTRDQLQFEEFSTNRRPARQGPRLPPVPPTPADYVDEDATIQQPAPMPLQAGGLHIDTNVHNDHDNLNEDNSAVTVRGPSVSSTNIRLLNSGPKGIWERRSESRTRRERGSDAQTAVEASNNPWAGDLTQSTAPKPADLVLSTGTSGLARRRTINKSTPRSARSQQYSDGLPSSGQSTRSSGYTGSSSARNMTPHPDSSRTFGSTSSTAPTPPFSPGSSEAQRSSPPSALMSLPTPPHHGLGQGEHGSLQRSLPSQSRESLRSQTPGSTVSFDSNSAASTTTRMSSSFAQAALDRHRQFLEQESAAANDRQRVELFAEFIVGESRIRRDRYATAIDGMGSAILDLTRDLFRPFEKPDSQSRQKPQPRSLAPSDTNSEPSSSHASSKEPLSKQMPLSPLSQDSFGSLDSPSRPNAPHLSFKPALSTIMSASEAADEQSSRGRPSSRWWETSETSSVSGLGGQRGVGRTRRESKYMGLPLRAWDEDVADSPAEGPSTQVTEAPPEKVGWHEQVTPKSSDPRKLDVSRLVTLPPPYPRHYPAVNNSHPDLGSTRSMVRNFADLRVLSDTKDTFVMELQDLEKEDETRRSHLQKHVKLQISEGKMSYAEAARIEADEEKKQKELLNGRFDKYQADVTRPLQGVLNERVTQITHSIDQLQDYLLDQFNPMEEGDERPALLEKLTLIKWLFETREQLYRENFELMSERNSRYKSLVLAPYQNIQSSTPKSPTHQEKILEVEAFFVDDAAKRLLAFEKEVSSRYEGLIDFVEESVKRGVEVQLSAFWDIGPSLVEVIQGINISRGVQMPGNSADYTCSQQYLWEVLCHAEKSTYQFIEGQVNLLCLLHEVKSAVAKQSSRVHVAAVASQPDRDPNSRNLVIHDIEMAQSEEEERLTTDLKEKVGVVERQWEEAIGSEVVELKERLRDWLIRNGEWDGVEET